MRVRSSCATSSGTATVRRLRGRLVSANLHEPLLRSSVRVTVSVPRPGSKSPARNARYSLGRRPVVRATRKTKASDSLRQIATKRCASSGVRTRNSFRSARGNAISTAGFSVSSFQRLRSTRACSARCVLTVRGLSWPRAPIECQAAGADRV